jgi:hypothetical protein
MSNAVSGLPLSGTPDMREETEQNEYLTNTRIRTNELTDIMTSGRI